MKILISGSSGLVGKNLLLYLSEQGYVVSRLNRNKNNLGNGDIFWDPIKMVLDSGSIEDFDAFIHLAGENIASKLWSAKQKNKILNSRVYSTTLLSDTLVNLKNPPSLFICASATGLYGHCGDASLDEKSSRGEGFLSEVVESWEQASEPVRKTTTRVVNLRFGVILSRQGGVLARLLPLFKLGLGGKIGDGRQYMPWISLEDVLGVIQFILNNNNIQGAVNVVAPEPCRNADFTIMLANVLSRPAFINVPALLLRFVLGEMARELFLSSANVKPSILIENKYPYIHPSIDQALQSILK